MAALKTSVRRRARHLRTGALGALLLLGCHAADKTLDVATPALDTFARAYIARLAARDFDGAEQSIAPAVRAMAGIRDSLVATARQIPAAPLDTVRLIGARRANERGVDRTLLTYEVHGAAGWAGVGLQFAEQGGTRVVEGVHAEVLPRSLSESYAFSSGWSLGGAAFLVVALGIVGFVVFTAANVVRSGMPHRWLWAIVALIGVGAVTFNWTTRAVTLQLLSVQLLAAAVSKLGLVAPWVVILSIPLGAIIASERLAAWRRRTRTTEP